MQQTSDTAYLIIQLGNRWTDILRLQPEQPVTIGRSSECQVVVRDELASRKHAVINAQAGGWVVQDLGSRNGTQVGGQTIRSEARKLREGETIQVGGCKMTFANSLATGFSSSGRGSSVLLFQDRGGDAQATVELDGSPTIVTRMSSSQWSSQGLELSAAGIDRPQAAVSKSASDEKWSFFYRLVFDLVSCGSPESAAQVALDRLLNELELTSGGVVTIESGSTGSDPEPLALAVLAARQAPGQAYHRVSDFLVTSVFQNRHAVLARNVQDDDQLSFARESGRKQTVSIIVAPLRQRDADGEKVIGLLHVYSSHDERMLGKSDLDLSVGIADNLAIALTQQQSNERLVKDLNQTRRKLDLLQEQLEQSVDMVGHSPEISKVRQAIARAAPTAATVLVRGESGVGKELVARAIHFASARANGPLVCMNCAALAPTLLESELFGHEKGAFTGATERKIGKFEAADGGTLMLDEIGEMIPELQAKFLRVLEGQSFERLGGNKAIRTDVRVIAATHRDLEEAVESKQFRADLYYRLRVIEIEVPPLRERPSDIPVLVEHFLAMMRHHAGRRISGIEPEALELLCRHQWPGNIRELKNVIERAIVLGSGSTIAVDDLSLPPIARSSGLFARDANSADLRAKGNGSADAAARVSTDKAEANSAAEADFQPSTIAELEQKHILATLEHTENNKSKAAQLLGIERSTLDRKLKRYQVE